MLAVVAWVAIIRYRFLVLFALLLQLLDQIGRPGAGQLKPLVLDDAPPGEIGTYILLPLVALAVWFSLPPRGAAPSR